MAVWTKARQCLSTLLTTGVLFFFKKKQPCVLLLVHVLCVTAFQVRLEWPTDLAVNPMDNSLYVLENNVILRITENHQVCITLLDYHRKPLRVDVHHGLLTGFQPN